MPLSRKKGESNKEEEVGSEVRRANFLWNSKKSLHFTPVPYNYVTYTLLAARESEKQSFSWHTADQNENIPLLNNETGEW